MEDKVKFELSPTFQEALKEYRKKFPKGNPNNRMRDKNLNITYPWILQNKLALAIWKSVFCKNGFHLFDETTDVKNHFLSCDACDLAVYMDKVQKFNE